MSEFTKKSEKDLQKMLKEKREELREYRFNTAGSQTRDVKAQRNVKKEIARILTELNGRRLEKAQS